MSTRSSSDASIPSSTSSSSSSSTAELSFEKVERYLQELTDLARSVLHPTYGARHRVSAFLAADRLHKIQGRVDRYFTKHIDCDFAGNGGWCYVLEIQTLMRMIETTLALSHRQLSWPQANVSDEEAETTQKKVYQNVEGLVFGQKGLNTGCA